MGNRRYAPARENVVKEMKCQKQRGPQDLI